MLQVKGAPTPGVNPFAAKKKKPKPGEEDPEAQAQQPGQPGKGPQQQPLDGQQPPDDEAEAEALEQQPDDEPDPGEDPDPDPNAEPDPNDPENDPEQPDDQQQPDASDDPEHPEDQADTQNPHEWAGDVDEEGDETDPSQSFAAFQRQDGAQAWLDRSDDGTLTGWVTDADGTVYRYSDPNAWAIDVDDAGMQQTHGPSGQQQADAQQQDQQPAPDQTQPGQERALFDDVTQKDATAGGAVTLTTAEVAADLAALTRPHLEAWAR